MDVLTAVLYTVGALAVLFVLLLGAGLVVVVTFVAYRLLTRKAKDAGIDFSDGIDDRELEIIRKMFSERKKTAAEQAVAVEMVHAAQEKLNAGKPPAA